jgi:hypothetical protein
MTEQNFLLLKEIQNCFFAISTLFQDPVCKDLLIFFKNDIFKNLDYLLSSLTGFEKIQVFIGSLTPLEKENLYLESLKQVSTDILHYWKGKNSDPKIEVFEEFLHILFDLDSFQRQLKFEELLCKLTAYCIKHRIQDGLVQYKSDFTKEEIVAPDIDISSMM